MKVGGLSTGSGSGIVSFCAMYLSIFFLFSISTNVSFNKCPSDILAEFSLFVDELYYVH